MAKILIIYDTDIAARPLSLELKKAGHEVYLDYEARGNLPDSQRWAIGRLLSGYDVAIGLFKVAGTEDITVDDINVAKAYARESDRLLVMSVVPNARFGIPDITEDTVVVRSKNEDYTDSVPEINLAISEFIGRRAARQQAAAEVAARLEADAGKYVDEAISSLSLVEKRNRQAAQAWYVTGMVALAAASMFLLVEAQGLTGGTPATLAAFLLGAARSAVAVALLVACARYAFVLGKSYSAEAVKSDDRIHAASFGRFYVRAYGEKTTWAELKEVFQHWNIDRRSNFADMTSDSFDPKIIEAIRELARALHPISAGSEKDARDRKS